MDMRTLSEQLNAITDRANDARASKQPLCKDALAEIAMASQAIRTALDQCQREIEIIAGALQGPRDDYGRMVTKHHAPLRKIVMGHVDKLPHGGLDRADQCAMLLQAILGVTVVSVIRGDKR
jgi:hypothetical protein